jgi:vacuolar-type H+-ATPase subunit I/STV1
MEFIVSSIIGCLLGSLTAAGAMIWYLHREDEKKEHECSERRAKEREKEKEDLRDYIAIAEDALRIHRSTESRLSYNVEQLERDIEEEKGGNLACHKVKELLLREREFIMTHERYLKNAKNRLEELEELDKEGGLNNTSSFALSIYGKIIQRT